MQLVWYGRNTTRKLQEARASSQQADRKLETLQVQNQLLREEVKSLETLESTLKKTKKELKRWTEREPEIFAHLGVEKDLAE